MQSRKDLYFITLKGNAPGGIFGEFRENAALVEIHQLKVSYYSENIISSFIVLRLVVKKIFKEFDKFR